MKTLLSESEVQAGVSRLAAQVAADYAGRPVTILGVMTGSVVLLADLIRQLEMPLRVGVVQASSYRGETTRGKLVIHAELMPEIEQRDVLLIDDIFDTGHTLHELRLHLEQLGARSVRTAVLLLKEGRQQVDMRPDYTVFTIPDLFVVGYGLDFRDAYRNLPYVAALDPVDIESPLA
ncbi:MAG: hypoxanthine phosphoribosyltransferase [Pirellulales bacterium]